MFALNDVLRAIRSRRWTVVGLAVAGLLVGLLLNLTATRSYVSTTQLQVAAADTPDAPAAYQGALFTKERIGSYVHLLSTEQLAQQVVDDLKLPVSAAQVAADVTGTQVPNTDIVQATVTDVSPERAQAIAASLTRQFTSAVLALETPVGSQASTVKVNVIQPASFSDSAVSPVLAQDLALGLVAGLVLGLAVALLRQRREHLLSSKEEVEKAAGLTLVSRLYTDGKLSGAPVSAALDGSSPTARAIRTLQLELQRQAGATPFRVVAVSSAVPDEGKSTVAAALAVALARTGQRVALVDGNLWRPRLARYLGVAEEGPGLTEVVGGTADLSSVLRGTGDPRLVLLPAGAMPADPAAVLSSPALTGIVNSLATSFDVVVVDSPPLLSVVDGASLAAAADVCVLVARYGRTTSRELADAAVILAPRVRLAGVVLNRVPKRSAPPAERHGYSADGGRSGAASAPAAARQEARTAPHGTAGD